MINSQLDDFISSGPWKYKNASSSSYEIYRYCDSEEVLKNTTCRVLNQLEKHVKPFNMVAV